VINIHHKNDEIYGLLDWQFSGKVLQVIKNKSARTHWVEVSGAKCCFSLLTLNTEPLFSHSSFLFGRQLATWG
jgi:hypothetical protein